MALTVHVGSILLEYTGGRNEVRASGADVAGVLADLDRQFPGLAFRVVDERGQIRPHVRLFLDQQMVRTPSAPVPPGAALHILGALSGG